MASTGALEPALSARAAALSGRAREQLDAGDRSGALDLARAALEVDPDHLDAHLLLSRIALSGDLYVDLLAQIHAVLRPRTYLEIGVATGATLRLAGSEATVIGVDPEPRLSFRPGPRTRIETKTSDAFFASADLRAALGGAPLDLAFIDGMHLFEYALRDFINVERAAATGTVVLYHDCYPLDARTAARERSTRFWTGDVWKLTLCLRKYRPDLEVLTFAAKPTGLGMVRGLDPASRILSERYTEICEEFVPLPYERLAAGKPEQLNLVPGDAAFVRRVVALPRGLRDLRTPGALRDSMVAAFAHHQAGRLDAAEAIYAFVLEYVPDQPDALGLLGRVYLQKGEHAGAIELLARADSLRPDHPFTANSLGEAWLAAGDATRARHWFERALALKPDLAEARCNLAALLNNAGNDLRAQGRLAEAEGHYLACLEVSPDIAEAHCNLGAARSDSGRLGEAERSYRHALSLNPRLAGAWDNLGLVLMRTGRLEEAEAAYRQALVLDPANLEARGNLVALLNYMPGRAPVEIFAEHRAYAKAVGEAFPVPAHANDTSPERRLRVGYVSGDFRDHSVAFFIEPVLARHDRDVVEVTLYSNFPRNDAVTARLRALARHWRDVATLTDEALADLIAADGIDVLVDLSGHTAYNRLPVFARKPAPVQATWLGYLNTTGLKAMDWRITDGVACPIRTLDALHTERLYRLPHSQWCYRPPAGAPQVASLPAALAGFPTFAVLANLAKIGAPALALWARVLREVSTSRLIVAGRGMAVARRRLIELLAGAGVAADRVELLDHGQISEYLELHNRIDVMLDTFPYTGGTTTCHALWMGVPVVTLTGDSAVSRGGASLLSAIGLEALIAQTQDRYVEIAASLAGDVSRLGALRSGMRERMRTSPLMDETRFARDLESAYRNIWRLWCASRRR